MRKLYVGVENLIEVDRLKDQATGLYLNGATLSFTLWDSAEETAVVSSRPLNYVAASDGLYQGSLPAATALTAGATYVLEITGTDSGATVLHEWHRCKAVKKGQD